MTSDPRAVEETEAKAMVEADPSTYIARMLGKFDALDRAAFNFCVKKPERALRAARADGFRAGAEAMRQHAMRDFEPRMNEHLSWLTLPPLPEGW